MYCVCLFSNKVLIKIDFSAQNSFHPNSTYTEKNDISSMPFSFSHKLVLKSGGFVVLKFCMICDQYFTFQTKVDCLILEILIAVNYTLILI